MSKRSTKGAPKGLEYYTSILTGKNPYVAISSLIEDHNFQFEFDEDSLEIKKVPTGNPYKSCKGCDICDEIQRWVPKMSEWKLAQLVVRPTDRWTARTIARMYKLGMGYRAIAKIVGGKPELEKIITRIISTEPTALATFIRCNLTNKQIKTLLPLDSYQLAEARERYAIPYVTCKGDLD